MPLAAATPAPHITAGAPVDEAVGATQSGAAWTIIRCRPSLRPCGRDVTCPGTPTAALGTGYSLYSAPAASGEQPGAFSVFAASSIRKSGNPPLASATARLNRSETTSGLSSATFLPASG